MDILVIGNGMVGYKFCEKLLSKSNPHSFRLTVFGEEPRPAYDRVHLSSYFAGASGEALELAPVDWYLDNDIDLHTGELVVEIDRSRKRVTTAHGRTVAYDKLVLATGSAAFVPAIPGTEKDGVFVYRTIEDLEAIRTYAAGARRAAVIGGGLLGLEAAKAALDLGLEAHVVEFAPRLMPRQLDEAGSRVLQRKLEALGIGVHLGKNTAAIEGGMDTAGGIAGMRFTDGTSLDVDMVIISAGIKPRDELAVRAGLAVGPRGGIVVDDLLRTADPDIYAVGECALHRGMVYGLVAPGYEMADVVAANLTGGGKVFTGFDLSTKLKLIGVDVASFGDPFCAAVPHRPVVLEDAVKGVYKRLNVSEDGKRLLGGVLVGEASGYNLLLQLCKNGLALPPDPEELVFGPRKPGAETPGNGVMDLPDGALVCSCEGVTKGTICGAVAEKELADVKALKACTKAGTGCGGCVPMLADLLTGTLKAQGKTVRKTLCEHFNYTRQELFDLIRVKGLRSYEELLAGHGQGYGCETCKPAVASMLASIWNEMILRQATIQDTNDQFLANIQRGGTYSVVPRVPGGEITPEKLVTIGQVARKYGLYCKITGGQRIDLFGARVDQLPDIWEELVAAGFESGHAYGKALRTVKSCVGSTWCRFGVQDAVGFAIEVEERYKGLRAPHKLKSAVSGCVRECAEAQSKDFGLIATEKGWNLYVGGNGGAKPQHAVLLAADLDKETCLRYIDRFLMFYIKTAEPLARTATWLNKLEGGINYLREVVVHDSLGIGAQLEREMQFLVNTYRCEWREVVETPELRRRFTHFVNSADPDPSIEFKEERGQKFPAKW